MKSAKSAVVVSAVAVALAGFWPDLAEARPGHRHHRHHHHHGLGFGLGLAIVTAPLWLAPRYAYPAPVYYAPPAPTVYVEQPPAQAYWYFCADSQAYYPYVQSCASGWQRVLPRPPQ